MNESFRLRKSIQVQGILYALLFSAATVGAISLVFIDEPARYGFEREHSVAIVVGMGLTICGGMTLLSVLMLVAYQVERVTVVGTTILVRSIFRQREFEAAAVDKLTWKTRPVGGRIDFSVANQRAKVELYSYGEEDRLRMIRLFHGLVPEEKQVDWPLFCHKIALRLRDRCSTPSADGLARPAAKGEVLITRRRYDRLAAVVLPAGVVVAIAAWWATAWAVLLPMPAVLVGWWLFLRYSVRQEGERQIRLSAMPDRRVMLLTLAVAFGSAGLVCALALAGVTWACTAGLVVLAPSTPFLIYGMYRGEKRRERETEIAAKGAPQRWNEGEPGGLDQGGDRPHGSSGGSARISGAVSKG